MKRFSRRQLVTGAVFGIAGIPVGVGGVYGLKASIRNVRVAGSGAQIAAYVRNHEVRKLQIGAGGQSAPGWLNTDIEPQRGEAYLDATKPFPIADGVLDYVYSEHLFEHLSYRDGQAMLRECRRTLKPGGKIRIATPNLLTLVRLFEDAKTDAMRGYLRGKLGADYYSEPLPQTISPECVILNYEMKSWGHQFVYDPKTLRESLERAGFQAIREFAPGESDDPQLAGMEARHRAPSRAVNDYETMVFQAVRP